MTESTTERADLSWLSEATPVKTTMRTSRRGRQPGKNPVAPHVKSAHESGDTLSLSVPSQHARQTERMLRRAALREGWSISVQVLDADPASATSDNVVALKDLPSLPDGTDVWVSFAVSDKDEKSESGATRADTGDENADPFAGTPDANAGDADDENPEPEPTKSPRKGRRSAA
jgi:hypothetical protein